MASAACPLHLYLEVLFLFKLNHDGLVEVRLCAETSRKYKELTRMGYYMPQLIEDHVNELYVQAIRNEERKGTKQ